MIATEHQTTHGHISTTHVIGMLLLVLLSGCQNHHGQDDGSDLAFVQLQNAMVAKEFGWIKNNLRIDNIKDSQRFEAQLLIAEAWLAGDDANAEKALQYLYAAEQLAPSDQRTKRLIIRVLNHTGDWQTLEQRLSDETIAPLHKVPIYLNIDPEKVPQLLSEVPEEEQHMRYHELKAQHLFDVNDLAGSMRHIETASKLGSLNVITYHMGYQLQLRLGNQENAASLMEIHSRLSSLRSLQVSVRDQLNIVRELLALNPSFSNNDAFNLLHIRLLLTTHQYTTASEKLLKMDVKSLDDDIGHELLNVLVQHAQFKLADEVLQLRSSMGFDERSGHLVCLIKSQLLEPAPAIKFCQQNIKQFPWYAATHQQIAELLILLDQLEAAKEHLLTAISHAPWNDEWRLMLARVLLSEGHMAEARDILDQALNPEVPMIVQFKKANGLLSL
ncbi:tetratricopeptide repeat protein [Marinicella sediminis]|uniref:Tetratricopeptide repeat protein n=1 Tax=Marinicella sediminis TaxID=1792834 RepID=A0ABV7JC46_9GAMM|nr:tetratricopeptide repeat protein [Marinicella sediminis]